MTRNNHDIVEAFFAAMPNGKLTTDFFTHDSESGSITSPAPSSAEAYVRGIAPLQSLFPDGVHYAVQSITAEEDRASAEVLGEGTFADGTQYQNRYVFLFEFRDGKIARTFEYYDPKPVEELIMPRITALLGRG
jgi:ketosteroid isomerase-like protein